MCSKIKNKGCWCMILNIPEVVVTSEPCIHAWQPRTMSTHSSNTCTYISPENFPLIWRSSSPPKTAYALEGQIPTAGGFGMTHRLENLLFSQKTHMVPNNHLKQGLFFLLLDSEFSTLRKGWRHTVGKTTTHKHNKNESKRYQQDHSKCTF